ncbi:InlB B-repeat-containing protein, partial [Candidatus Bathycorpusculum sp.]|uniref:InlB B-repeat-containing protein n=1 Tax=Candidatus Bathycorpusculum sp. TaxID=2994959 RepID=UPI00282D34DA|nr:InlB B-repeat-containing protein [Candidatus Termitimicrobium sp.]MCL2432759.1 InlB B-repeat-containing protein [Candidatus Termitimicrobium sp.]
MKIYIRNGMLHKANRKLISLTLIFTILFTLVTIPQSVMAQTGLFEIISVDPSTAIVTPDGAIQRLPNANNITFSFHFTSGSGSGHLTITNKLFLNRIEVPGAVVVGTVTPGVSKEWYGNITITGIAELNSNYEVQFFENNPNQVYYGQLYFGTLIENRYLVQFIDWDGRLISELLVLQGDSAIPPPDPERVGYTFTGWIPSFSNITGNLTVTAQYTINQYTVTFNSTGGVPTPPSQQVTFGGTVTRPSDPTNDGYVFLGWYMNGTQWNFTTDTVSTNLTLYAMWGEPDRWINYDANGGTGTMPPTGTTLGVSVTLAPNEFSRPDYSFLGWNTNPDGSGVPYSDGATFTYLFDGNLTLYAQWGSHPGSVTVLKQTVPSGSLTVFNFTTSTPEGSFGLVDGQTWDSG